MLNHLLFGPPAAEAVTDAGNASHSRNNSSNCSSSSTAANNSRPLHCSWWSRSADLDGPDLATVVIPTDRVSGMGLKVGDRWLVTAQTAMTPRQQPAGSALH